MAELKLYPTAIGYHYDPTPQRTKGWFDRRIAKVSASRLEDFLSVSKAKATLGKKLKKRLDYELELKYEREFGVSYNNYTSDAMEDGRLLEAFALRQYEHVTGNTIMPVGCWYSDKFVASPDGAVYPQGCDTLDPSNAIGLAEAKVLRDNSFSELLTNGFNGTLNKHWKQMQGQMRASGYKWVDFVAINMNTKKIFVIRVEADSEFHEWLDLNLEEPLTDNVSEFNTKHLFDFVDEAPEYKLDNSEFNFQ